MHYYKRESDCGHMNLLHFFLLLLKIFIHIQHVNLGELGTRIFIGIVQDGSGDAYFATMLGVTEKIVFGGFAFVFNIV